MIRRDYILRMIEQFGTLWSQFVRDLEGQLFPQARETVKRAYQQMLSLHPDAARSLSSRDLQARMQFSETPEAGRDRCLILSALLKADGDLARAEEQPNLAADYYQKSLDLVLAMRLHHAGDAWPPFVPPVDQLVALLGETSLPITTQHLLLHYYEQQGAYAKAEDTLFEMLDAGPAAAVVALGDALYQRLEALSDAALHAGNFSRAEIASGQQALHRHGQAA